MRPILFVTVTALVAGCGTTSAPILPADPIDRLATELSAPSYTRYHNGPILKLPADVSVAVVVSKVLDGQLDTYSIMEVRKVKIFWKTAPDFPESWTGALVRTPSGKKIVLFRYDESRAEWWTGFYDLRS
jgi:hypothetical protein